MFSDYVESEIRALAAERGLDPAALLAVAEVESGGQALTEINGKPMPLILFEPHVFHRRLPPQKRAGAIRAGLAGRKWGDAPYPRSQRARYAQLERAKTIDREAAFAACSWGVGQVLGENARWLGYDSAEALAEEAISGPRGQCRLMLRFIDKSDLAGKLAKRDWRGFAKGYNGPGYARHGYHEKLGRAWSKWSGRAPVSGARAFLSLGDRGEAVAALQRMLAALGVAVSVDGVFGKTTRSAVLAFQAGAGLVRDGVVGAQTRKRIDQIMRGAGIA